MPRLPRIILFIFTSICLQVQAQTHTIDSLKKRVALAVNNEQKANALLDLCTQKYSLTADSLYQYAAEVKKLNSGLHNPHNSILADYYTTYSLLINGMEDSSLHITNHYLDKLRDNKDEHEAYLLFFKLKGLIYYRTNKSQETVNIFYELLSEAQQHNDTLNMLIAKRGISLSYIVNGQNQEGLKIFHSAEELIPDKNSSRYSEIYGLLLINASISFLHLHQATRSALYADSCEYYGNGVINMGRKSDNLFILCQGLVVKGLILSYKEKIAEAEQLLQQGLQVRKIIGDTLYIISDMSVLASFYANTKQTEKGVAICNTGIELARRRHSPALLLLLYTALAENYKATGNYEKYAEALKFQMTVKDSLNKKSSTEELNNLQAKYDLQKQQNTIIQQRLDITQKNYWLYGSLLLVLFAATIGWLVFKNNNRKQKMKLELMREEEKRMSLLAVTSAEENERKRIAADLHDNMGAYATAIIANVDEMMETKEVNETSLNSLKNNAAEIMANLRDTIWASHKEKITITGISDRFKIYLQKITPAFPNIKVEIEENVEQDISFSPVQALNIFRILQEALTNALKHSHGNSIKISITSNEEFKIIILDNGIGINGAGGLKNRSGLLNMKKRADESGFVLYTDKNDTDGTQIILTAGDATTK